jgi:hypothetical protein
MKSSLMPRGKKRKAPSYHQNWERIIAEARRYDQPLEEMSPELWRMVEQMLYPHRRRATTKTPRVYHKTRKPKPQKAGSVEPRISEKADNFPRFQLALGASWIRLRQAEWPKEQFRN